MKSSIETSIICGVCGATRKEANHWVVVKWGRTALAFRTLCLPSDEAVLRSEGYWAVCGDECAAKVLSDWCHESRQVKAQVQDVKWISKAASGDED